jgi:hypothetical protein
MEAGKPIHVEDLVQNIGYPDYPAMPSPDGPIAIGA